MLVINTLIEKYKANIRWFNYGQCQYNCGKGWQPAEAGIALPLPIGGVVIRLPPVITWPIEPGGGSEPDYYCHEFRAL